MIQDFIQNTKATWRRDWGRLIRNHAWEADDEGALLVGKAKIIPASRIAPMVTTLNGQGLVRSFGDGGIQSNKNLWTTEGRNHFLDAVFRNAAQTPTWYVAPASGNVSPVATWTAANFAANATELTTQYSEATRVEYVEGSASAGALNNTASPATVTAAEASVVIWVIGLLSVATKGSTSGILAAASKYGTSYTLPAIGNTVGIDWTLTLTAT